MSIGVITRQTTHMIGTIVNSYHRYEVHGSGSHFTEDSTNSSTPKSRIQLSKKLTCAPINRSDTEHVRKAGEPESTVLMRRNQACNWGTETGRQSAIDAELPKQTCSTGLRATTSGGKACKRSRSLADVSPVESFRLEAHVTFKEQHMMSSVVILRDDLSCGMNCSCARGPTPRRDVSLTIAAADRSRLPLVLLAGVDSTLWIL